MATFKRCFELILVFLVVSIVFFGCDRTETILGDIDYEEDNSPIVSGVIIYKNGIEVASSFRDEVYGEEIKLEKGENSDVYSLLFLDEYEDPMQVNIAYFRLECVSCDPACLQVERTSDLGRWEFRMCGLQVGQYALIIRLKKFQELVYTSPEIPTIVN